MLGRHSWRGVLLGLVRWLLALSLRGRRSIQPNAGPGRRATWTTHWQSVSKWSGHSRFHDTAIIVIGILTCTGGLHVLQVDPWGVGREVRVFVIRVHAIVLVGDLGVLLLPPLLQLEQEKSKG